MLSQKLKFRLGIGFLLFGALFMLINSSRYFIQSVVGILELKDVSEYLWFRLVFKSHIGFGVLAILLALFNLFLPLEVNI